PPPRPTPPPAHRAPGQGEDELHGAPRSKVGAVYASPPDEPARLPCASVQTDRQRRPHHRREREHADDRGHRERDASNAPHLDRDRLAIGRELAEALEDRPAVL